MKYKKLTDFIAAKKDIPFEWGKNDCCLFACDAVKAMTGIDYSTPFRDKYLDEAGATQLVTAAGGIRAIATAALGAEIKPLMAQRGDVVLIESPRPTLAICMGSEVVAPGPEGLEYRSIKPAVAAWRIN